MMRSSKADICLRIQDGSAGNVPSQAYESQKVKAKLQSKKYRLFDAQ
jgi:hypothetical protein